MHPDVVVMRGDHNQFILFVGTLDQSGYILTADEFFLYFGCPRDRGIR